MKKINIAFVCDILEIGGQEMACVNIMRYINKWKFNPVLYSFRGGTLLKEIRDLGVKVIVGSNKDPLSFKTRWTEEDAREKRAYLSLLRNEMRKDNIDIALIFAWGDGLIAAQEAGVACVIEKLDGTLLIDKINDKSCFDKIVCESKKIKDIVLTRRKYLRCKEEQIELIYNGIDLSRFDKRRYNSVKEREKLRLRTDEFVIGYVGRIDTVKNLQLLISSAKMLVSDYRFNKFKVVIVGPDHGDMFNIQKLSHELGIADKVVLTGLRKDIPNLLSAFDIFTITSFCEGMPTAVIEAMAMGLPIISTATGSIPEMIENNGFLVDSPGPKAFAERLHILMKDTKLRKKMGERSIRLSKKYDIHKTTKKYEELFMNCLEKKCVRR